LKNQAPVAENDNRLNYQIKNKFEQIKQNATYSIKSDNYQLIEFIHKYING